VTRFRGGRRGRAAAAVCALLLAFLAPSASAAEPRLAVLIAAPWSGETAMAADIRALSVALAKRGFTGDRVVVADDVVTRKQLLDVLARAAERIAGWDRGTVFFGISGHGSFQGSTAAEARPALQLADGPDRDVPWDDVFAALRVPVGVRVILLPDS
jgi:hypothetical protein